MAKILVRYAEIGLKGGNLSYFENKLIKNIKLSLGSKVTVEKQRKQFLVTVPSNLINQSITKLQNIFGIAWLANVKETKTDLKDIASIAVKLAGKPKSFALRVSRVDKNIDLTSQDVAIKVGDKVRLATKAKVKLNNPELEVFINLNKNYTHLYTKKIPGPGGLPVGTSGKVLSLLSGGFDSIAASYMLAKRGARVDFLHFHVFNDQKKVLDSKIKTISDKLSKFTLSKNLHLASYSPFQLSVLDLEKNLQKQELVVFRRLMVKVGESLAKKHGYQALILGDSLGQVASQTMENIVAVDQAVDIPIFRPLIGMDKKDIITLVSTLDLEKEAIKPYKDCCSIVSKSPTTKANLEKIKSIEKRIDLSHLVKTILKDVQITNLQSN